MQKRINRETHPVLLFWYAFSDRQLFIGSFVPRGLREGSPDGRWRHGKAGAFYLCWEIRDSHAHGPMVDCFPAGWLGSGAGTPGDHLHFGFSAMLNGLDVLIYFWHFVPCI